MVTIDKTKVLETKELIQEQSGYPAVTENQTQVLTLIVA
jgi:hypothetical protein